MDCFLTTYIWDPSILSFSLSNILILCVVGALAGFIDAIAGGGGIFLMPTLLTLGLPPVVAVGTGKVSAIAGTGMAGYVYYKKGYIHRNIIPLLAIGIMGGIAGSFVLQSMHNSRLLDYLVVILLLISIFALMVINVKNQPKALFKSIYPYFLVVAGITFYDGFIGPGTGIFLMASLFYLMGFSVKEASGYARWINVCSNGGSLLVLIPLGHVLYGVALIMLVFQLIGGYFGAHTAILRGSRFIKYTGLSVGIIMLIIYMYKNIL